MRNVLSKEQLQILLTEYPIGSVHDYNLFLNGIINSNYKLKTDKGNFLLRVYTPERNLDEIRFETSVLERLGSQDYCVQRPIASKSGEIIGQFKGNYFVLLTFVEGQVLDIMDINPTICYDVGARLGQMQNTLEGFIPEGEKSNADFDFIDNLNVETFKKLNALGDPGIHQFERLNQDWEELRLLFSDLSLMQGIVHADIYSENTIIKDGKLKAFIDFDDSYFGVLLYDLSLILMEFSILEEGHMNFEFVKSMMEGYLSKRKITQKEINLLFDSMRMLCYKYLGYTSGLAQYDLENLLDNPYLLRLAYFRNDAVRQTFDKTIIKSWIAVS